FFPGALALGIGGLDGWVQWLAVAWICLAIAIPATNRRRQRLGDMIAGTIVILRPQAVLLPDAAVHRQGARPAGHEAFGFSSAQLDHYGAYELQTLEGLVRQNDDHLARGTRPSIQVQKEIEAVSAAIRTKIAYGVQIGTHDHARFLSDFYRAQRRYLEEKQLLGEARADKFHASRKEAGS
ncbi:MAG: RDD family protein, partial [Pseudomonadota bacterium]